MKDLDFDELDRAVNSLMTNVPKTPEPKKAEGHEQTLTITPTIKDDVVPSFTTLNKTVSQINEPEKASTPISAPALTQSQPAARPSQPLASRRGRFMDMVRPSTTPKMPEPTRAVSRQGMMIEPSAPPVPRAAAPVSTAVPPAAKESSPTSEWPDPIEMTPKADTIKLLDTLASEASLEATNEPTSRDDYMPLATPFLADTKVEKRPLGGSANASDQSVIVEDLDDAMPSTADTSSQLPPHPIDTIPSPLPEELSSDLVALEAGANTSATQAAPTETPEVTALPSAAEPDKKPTPAAPPEEKLLPAGPISIPQQYREEPSTSDKQSGSIYDTDTYHQPLAHPAKKKSGWMWVIWTVILLLVGAGAAVAFYYSSRM